MCRRRRVVEVFLLVGVEVAARVVLFLAAFLPLVAQQEDASTALFLEELVRGDGIEHVSTNLL